MMDRKLHIALSIMAIHGILVANAQAKICANKSFRNQPIERLQVANDEKLYIPIVVHVVYQNDEQNISSDQIKSQIKVINDDFNAQNANYGSTVDEFSEIKTKADIAFYLSSPIGLDLDEIGVIRVSTGHSAFVNQDIHYSELGGSDAIEPESHLNIWVTDLGGEVYGYSQSYPDYTIGESGIVIDYQYFGTVGTAQSPYDGGRTLTHEIGHFLGLAHPWGVEVCADGDGISDTPEQDGPIYQCDLEWNSCGTLAATQNFMNLAPDACMTFFTAGQVSYMRSVLLSQKSDLVHERPVLGTRLTKQPRIYPVPAKDHFFINGSKSEYSLRIWDSNGIEVPFQTERSIGNEFRIIPTKRIAGLYIVQLEHDGLVFREKMILKN
ncbi:M43 family zinc metalloprotease [Marinoscillum sp.]|uniref:M43 family zinc metalloprotease n=1 Tax=Marinoscillum sp. TaxID=2024838 RepID=UPI003BAAF564